MVATFIEKEPFYEIEGLKYVTQDNITEEFTILIQNDCALAQECLL